ncbi:hypothetical protein H2198_000611 [Neophaeococcomyces mojaviensis]|uniref:Uncharacterized protein n=1 Tax=Neophaeococcomyces mojaviensis TaxID=3383035 RepID=A0ACC3AJV8_9EURO|nr:hypothetical protein H2198_000611 [Knufia sp. JES_112]
MPQSLRKACHACTQSKRRCAPQLPACERCVKKRIPCVYDLEPVTRDTVRPASNDLGSITDVVGGGIKDELKIVYDSVCAARDASAAAMANGADFSSKAARPMLMANDEFAGWLFAFFVQVAKDGIAGKGSPFVHSWVLKNSRSPLDVRTHDCSTTDIDADAGTPSTRTELTIAARLSEIHNLVILSLKRLLLEKPSTKQSVEVEHTITQMFSSTRSLWTISNQMSDNFTPWESWVMAESIRRAMFAAIMVRGLWYATANGYCYYEPFFESLPFDPRAGAWEAMSEDEWGTAIERHGGEHTKLKSYHEFITMAGTKLNPEEDGDFQRMLFVAYHGSNGIRALEELDKGQSR